MRFALNIDHIATLRNARGEDSPSPLQYALQAEALGIDGIVVHLREDRRHIKDADVYELKEHLKVKLDLEMASSDDVVSVACKIKPELATLVPEKRQELTTEGGLDLESTFERTSETIRRLHDVGTAVSLFIEPDKKQIDLARTMGAEFIEIHTGVFANATGFDAATNEKNRIVQAAAYAHSIGLRVNAGHGLNYKNMNVFRDIAHIEEVSIGHAVIAYSVFYGIERAINDMRALIDGKH